MRSRYLFLLLSLFALMVIIFSSCIVRKKSTLPEAITYKNEMTVTNNEGPFLLWMDKLIIARKGSSSLMLQTEYKSFMDEAFESVRTKNPFFVYAPKSDRALYFESLTDETPRQLPKDSLVAAQIWTKNIMDPATDSLIRSEKIDGDVVVRTFVPRIKQDESFPDSVYIYYSRHYNGAPFEITSYGNTYEGRTAFKAVVIYNHRQVRVAGNVTSGRVDWVFELLQLSKEERKDLDKYFLKAKS
jgi:hypothetical protein